VALLVVLPWWRNRVWVHRQPYEIHFALNDFITYTSDYALLALLIVGWAWLLIRGRRLSLGPWFVTGPLATMLVLSATSAAWAVDSPYALYQALRQLVLLAFFLLLVNLPEGRALSRRWLSAGIASSVIVQAVVGLLQVWRGRSLGLTRLGELTLNPEWSGISVVMRGETRWLRAYGLTQHPNLLGGVLAGLLLVLVGAYVDRVRFHRMAPLLLVPYALGLGTLLMTFSRGAWMAAAVGGLTLLATVWRSSWRPNRDMARAMLSLVALTLGIGVLFAATQWSLLQPRLGLTYQGAEERSVDERSTLIAGARALRQLRPVLGVGAGGFSTALYRLAPESIAAYPVYQPVHNVLMLLATEVGAPGAILWILLILAPVVAVWIRPVPESTGWLAGLTGVLVVLFTAGWHEAYPWRSQQGALLLWLTLGLWARAWSSGRRGRHPE
jgi:hypothetical protein